MNARSLVMMTLNALAAIALLAVAASAAAPDTITPVSR
jgi:hypothetical protein